MNPFYLLTWPLKLVALFACMLLDTVKLVAFMVVFLFAVFFMEPIYNVIKKDFPDWFCKLLQDLLSPECTLWALRSFRWIK